MSTESRIHSLEEAVKELQKQVEALQANVSELRDRQDGQNDTLYGCYAAVFGGENGEQGLQAELAALTDEVRGALHGYLPPEEGVPEDESEEDRATRIGAIARIAELETLVRGRNRSAPVKRNMTDEDAERVLKGDVASLGHKEAGEQVGLTYAQVYSCRLEYTFKHVHKKLRDAGWKNPFVK